MTPRFLRAVGYVLDKHEGGVSDHPADPGGRTRWGISEAAHPSVWDGAHPNGPSLFEALELYWSLYWMPLRCDDILFTPLANKLFDVGVNLGGYKAVRLLQVAINDLGLERVTVDGALGPITLRTVNGMTHPEALVASLAARQIEHYRHGNPIFRAGWFRRGIWNGRL